jgi:hypothetical protein
MPTTNWNLTTIEGVEYLVIDTAQFRIPLDFDPGSNMFIAVAAPTGGLGAFPALVQGDVGPAPELADPSTTVTFLEPDDVTPDSAEWVETAPGVIQFQLVIHKGPQGEPGDTVLDVNDFGVPLAGKILVVNEDLDALEYTTEKVGDRFVPSSMIAVPSGNPLYTMAAVSVPAQDFDWRPQVEGQATLTAAAGDSRYDLIARLDAGTGGTPETSGPIVARAFGTTFGGWGMPTAQTQVLSASPPAAASATYDKVLQGNAAVIYFRAERQSGTGTISTSSSTSNFCVRVRPIPV